MSRKHNNQPRRDSENDANENAEPETSVVAEALKAGGSFFGPDIAKAMQHGIFKVVGMARNYGPIDAFLRGLGEYGGIVDRLPNFTNALVEKCVGQKVFGSDIAGDILRDTALHAAEGFADAVRAAHGDELKHVGQTMKDVATKAAAEVAAIEFAVDPAGFGHRATCKCVAGNAALRQLTYAVAAEEGLTLAQCCVPEYRKRVKTRVQTAERRERSALDILGSLDLRDRNEYLRWVRTLTSLEEQAIAMHALVDLDTDGELIGFMALNDEERYRHLDLLKERVVRRLSVKGEIDALVNRLKEFDQRMKVQADSNRQAAMASWARLNQPAEMSILGILGL